MNSTMHTVTNQNPITVKIRPDAYLRLTNLSGGGPLHVLLPDGGAQTVSAAQHAELIIPTPGADPVSVTVSTAAERVAFTVTALPADVADWPAPVMYTPPAA